MRIKREVLLKIAGDTVARRTRNNHRILSAYLCGSLLDEDYALGGTADIDLTFIYVDQAEQEREIERLTDQVHLDIAHYPQSKFRNPRDLREDAWLGPTIFRCQILHDPQHFMHFTQASVRGQFYHADHVLARVRQLAEAARATWMRFYRHPPEQTGPQEVGDYLRAVGRSANAVASLYGPPLTDRRLLASFARRAETAGKPGMYAGLLGLLGAPRIERGSLDGLLNGWRQTLEGAAEGDLPARLNPRRWQYYQSGFEALLGGDGPHDILWPLLRTWTEAAGLVAENSAGRASWEQACRQLGLLDEEFESRLAALDAYLDLVEETLDQWARKNGI